MLKLIHMGVGFLFTKRLKPHKHWVLAYKKYNPFGKTYIKFPLWKRGRGGFKNSLMDYPNDYLTFMIAFSEFDYLVGFNLLKRVKGWKDERHQGIMTFPKNNSVL